MKPLLTVQGLGKTYGGLVALHDVSFEVGEGQIIGVMGANGAGKTTLFSLIAGNVPPSAGDIQFDGRSIVGLRADQVCRLGVARTFPMLTVLENLRTAAMFGKAQIHDRERADAAAHDVLKEVGLAPMAHQLASTLTLSGQKRLEIARAVTTGARLILLDEVMAGLTPTEVANMLQTLRHLQTTRGFTLLVIEHVMRALMELCEHIIVLHHGELIAQGTPDAIAENQSVLAVYFGEQA
jgi:branched-chain amino acid transport system ATP-binding protein